MLSIFYWTMVIKHLEIPLCEWVAETELGNRGIAGGSDYSLDGVKACKCLPWLCMCSQALCLPKGVRDCLCNCG